VQKDIAVHSSCVYRERKENGMVSYVKGYLSVTPHNHSYILILNNVHISRCSLANITQRRRKKRRHTSVTPLMISPKGDTHTTRAAHSSSVVASSNTTQFEELKQYMQKYSPEDNMSDSLLSGFLIQIIKDSKLLLRGKNYKSKKK
jgi:hypothetical protein